MTAQPPNPSPGDRAVSAALNVFRVPMLPPVVAPPQHPSSRCAASPAAQSSPGFPGGEKFLALTARNIDDPSLSALPGGYSLDELVLAACHAMVSSPVPGVCPRRALRVPSLIVPLIEPFGDHPGFAVDWVARWRVQRRAYEVFLTVSDRDDRTVAEASAVAPESSVAANPSYNPMMESISGHDYTRLPILASLMDHERAWLARAVVGAYIAIALSQRHVAPPIVVQLTDHLGASEAAARFDRHARRDRL